MRKQSLAGLPNEVLTEVLSHVTDQSHLAKIALVSKQFKDLVELHLYRHISLDIRCSAKELRSTDSSNRNSHKTLPSFVRFDGLMQKMSLRQNLARQVHTLSLKVQRELWNTPFNANSRLLALLPGLRALSLNPPPCHLIVPHKNSTITSLRLDFSQVTDHSDEEGHGPQIPIVQLQVIAGHLLLPNLRKLQVEKTLLLPKWDESIHLPPASSIVEDLRLLEYRKPSGDGIEATFLSSINCLKRFVFEMSPHIAECIGSTDSFRRALWRHKETIEELAVATSQGSPRMIWTLGSFRYWSSLKFLAISDRMIHEIVGGKGKWHELLPPSLQELQIQYSAVHDGLMPQALNRTARATARREDVVDMRHLAYGKTSRLPRLNRVVWWLQKSEFSASALKEITLEFEQVGVKFEWVAEVLFKNTPFGKRLCEWQD